MEKIANGVWKLTLGIPEEFTPYRLMDIKTPRELPDDADGGALPFSDSDIRFNVTKRGCVVEIPMNNDENFYGFGLQFHSLNHAGRKRQIRVNSDPAADTGESHAPVPFYASTGGYGLYIDTARYVTVYCGTNSKKGASGAQSAIADEGHTEFSENALYALKKAKERREIIIDIPAAQGVDLFFFSGGLTTAVSRYNLFSGGGCVPPLWGLGNWYRAYGGSSQDDILRLAAYFRENNIPVDVLGIEPGWHSHSYSCSYKWKESLFPAPQEMLDTLNGKDFKVNLWEHLFVHPTADFYEALKEYSCDFEVWNGLVPDLAMKETRDIFASHHLKEFIDKGVKGFKLDECDNSDYNRSNWSFPDTAVFPSGMDGEQMHNMIGLLYQQVLMGAFKEKNLRTLSQVRSSGALAASMPFVLYSDLYSHRQFITALVNSGFSGLLWAPEVRSCDSPLDLVRRLQTTVFSHHSLLNCWRIPNPPWLQVDIAKNLKGELMEEKDEITEICKKYLTVRMSLIPYLYSAFYEYRLNGIPPIRALVMDFEHDEAVLQIKDEYMFGPSLLVAPLTKEDGNVRTVYLPEGDWYDFWTNQKYAGGQAYRIEAEMDTIPVFARAGSIIPVAKPLDCITNDSVFELTMKCYGKGRKEFTLYEDDGVSFDYVDNYNIINIVCDENNVISINKTKEGHGFNTDRYKLCGYEFIE